MRDEIVVLENISKHFKVGDRTIEVLKNINLRIMKGDFVVIMGSSGSGKTTLLNIIGLLDRPSSGSYRLLGKDTKDLSDTELSKLRNEYIGFVFQQFYLIPYLNALDNVFVPLLYSKKKIKNPETRAKDLLKRFGLYERVFSKPSQLSGGEQQRVAIARAIVNDPEMILADEPTGALDSKTSFEIMELFSLLNENEKKTVVLVTHDKEVAKFGKRIIFIKDGNIFETSKV